MDRRNLIFAAAATAAVSGLALKADATLYAPPDPAITVYINKRTAAVLEYLGGQTGLPSSEAAGAVGGALIDGIAEQLIKLGLVPEPGV